MTLFELAAVLTLNKSSFDKGIDEAEGQAKGFGSKLASGLGGAAKAIAGTTVAAAGAIAKLTKDAVQSYSEYEQLVGGVETLFGVGGKSLQEYAESVGKSVGEARKEFIKATEGQQKILDAADEAYKTAGLSANEYMETVTSFSASLIQSLGGDTSKAADAANMAVTDMSDNANKMGTSMGMIQNAYQGFAKQNYTMLDNLKLGYGGTTKEMYRLLQDAASLNEEFANTANFSMNSKGQLEAGFADIVKAIHIVQTEMGITGTTANEASGTIQGSAGAMKAAWDNLVAGLGKSDADIEGLAKTVVASFTTTFKNIIPIVEQALSGIGTALKEGAPIISEAIVSLLGDGSLLNSLVGAGLGLLNGLISALSTNLPSMLSTAFDVAETLTENISKMLPKLAEVGLQILLGLAKGISENIGSLTKALVQTVTDSVSMLTDAETMTGLLEAGLNMVKALGQGISENIGSLTNTVITAVTDLALMLTNPDTLTGIIEAGLSVVMALGQGILNALPTLIEQLPLIIDNIVQTLTNSLPLVLNAGIQLLMSVVQAIPSILPSLNSALPQILNSVTSFLISSIPVITKTGIDLLVSLVSNLPVIIDSICKSLPSLISGLVDGLLSHLPEIIQAGIDLLTHLLDNIPAIIGGLASAVGSIVSGIFETFTNPENIGKVLDIGKRLIEGVWEGICKMGSWIMDKVGGFFGGIVDSIKDFLGIHSPSTVFADIGGNMAAGIGVGFDDEFGAIRKDIDDQMDFTATSAVKVDRNINDTYSSAYSGGEGGNSGGNSSESKQPVIVVVQLESGIELARALIEDINDAKRIDGIAY